MMKTRIEIKCLEDFFIELISSSDLRKTIAVIRLDKRIVERHFSKPILMPASSAILVQSGTATLRVNNRTYQLEPGSVVLLSASHLFAFDLCSQQVQMTLLTVTRNFFQQMESTDMVYKRIHYEVRTFQHPLISLQPIEVNRLIGYLDELDFAINDASHQYQNDLVLNLLMRFYLEMSNLIDRQPQIQEAATPLTRNEATLMRCMQLLETNFRVEHRVEYYAEQLHLSAHHLTLVVKEMTAQTLSDFIYEMLYSEARHLLHYSQLSIKEISEQLCFSDQSAFGKFFKRRAGISASSYAQSMR